MKVGLLFQIPPPVNHWLKKVSHEVLGLYMSLSNK